MRKVGTEGQWSSAPARERIEVEQQSIRTLYIDSNVRVYQARLSLLPRRYMARQRLCLRVITDYWVNTMDSQPFFVVAQAADPGLLKKLEQQTDCAAVTHRSFSGNNRNGGLL